MESLSRVMLSGLGTILIVFSCVIYSFAQSIHDTTRLNALKSSISKILRETNTPAAGIALVTKDTSIWVTGLGKANTRDSIEADENTLFRIASISKMFVAMSIMKLQEEGKLDLQDKVRDLVPEIDFTNPWEGTDPVRIVHLLEHTTGWDDYHLTEQVSSSITLKEGLDYHPHSRTSRWVPGTRVAYCNSGSGVAGYIVEKITGRKYEEYVKENFLNPLGMKSTTFFNDSIYKKRGATLYDQNLQPLAYRHVIQRPAGSINSSATEIASLVRFFLNRGRSDSARIISEESILRMETSKSSPGARAGLQLGYGLANFTTLHNGHAFHGHNGGLPGALSELAYLPEHGIGHAFFINSGNSNAFQQISTLIRDFEVQTLNVSSSNTPAPYTGGLKFRPGYYVSINPRIQWGYFMDRLIDIYKFEANDRFVLQSWILPGKKTIYYPLTDSTFRTEKSDKIIMVKAVDPLAGDVIYNDQQVLKPIPYFIVFGQLAVILLWIFLMVTGILMWGIACIRYWLRGWSDSLQIRKYPSLASILFIVSTFLMILSGKHYNEKLAEPGLLSISLMLISVLFIIYSFVSVVIVFRSRKQKIGTLTFLHMALLSALNVVVTIYLLWYDVIPIITWA